MSSTKIKRFGRLVGDSPGMKKVFSMIRKAARTDVPVLIVGETGAGKELVAREIHERSERRGGPFVDVNMGTLTPQLVASELFGHVRGAFTGATDGKRGRFAEADGGTLFLDEIATMNERVQVALLRVLETGRFRPVGGKRNRNVDVRLIAATNVSLEDALRRGLLREDLLHRLWVFRIAVPPLREHPDDLVMLSYHFLDAVRREFGFEIEEIAPGALRLIKGYSWPGNVRELRNVVVQAAVLAECGPLLPEHLPPRIRAAAGSRAGRTRSKRGSVPRARREGPVEGDRGCVAESGRNVLGVTRDEGVFIPVGVSLDEAQKAYIMETLRRCAYNKARAARVLGISRKTLYDRLARWRRTE
jgi:DNA-binding NtrC family response regulator